MEAVAILEQAESVGAFIKVIDGKLKGKNLIALDDATRLAIRAHKAEIINLLQGPTIEIEPLLKPCPLCSGQDFLHGHKGGYFCITCQPDVRPGVPVKAGGTGKRKR